MYCLQLLEGASSACLAHVLKKYKFYFQCLFSVVFKADSKEEEDACGSQPKGLQKTDLYHLQKVGIFLFLPAALEVVTLF
jgi:origin recognition complex subunit 3